MNIILGSSFKMFTKIILLLSLLALINAQIPSFERCPKVKTVQNFQAAKYLGKWYEQKRYFFVFQAFAKCTTAEYSLRDDGKVKVRNTDVNEVSGITEIIEGIAHNVSATEAKYIVNFPTMPVKIDAPYWVLGTDYETYSVVWSCLNAGLFTTRNAWVLTREPEPSQEVFSAANQVIEEAGIPKGYFISTKQVNCTYL